MGFLQHWQSKVPSPNRRANDFFTLGKFFDELEQNLEALNTSHSGLSISSDDKNIYIEAHVPGLTAKEIEVSIDNNDVLWIKGEKKAEQRDTKRKYYRQSQIAFSYCVPLWQEIDTSCEPEAICKDGIMTVSFPKKKDKQIEAKRIKVKE